MREVDVIKKKNSKISQIIIKSDEKWEKNNGINIPECEARFEIKKTESYILFLHHFRIAVFTENSSDGSNG